MEKMKKLIPLIALIFFLSPLAAHSQEDAPNLKESINYFTNYFNESVVQAIEIQQYAQKEKLPRDEGFFYVELLAKLQTSINLAFNARDMYFLYGRTMYCYAKDERKFIQDRLENILVSLKNIQDTKYFGLDPAQESTTGNVSQNAAKFDDRLGKLMAFIEKSSAIFN